MTPPPAYLAQNNFVVGDLDGNRRLLLESAQKADSQNASVMVSPELALTGYCPEDMLHDAAFVDSAMHELNSLASQSSSLPMLIGLPWRENGNLYNAAALVRNKRVEQVYKKVFLPNYSVFDERRYFNSGANSPMVFEIGGESFGVQICADTWEPKQASEMAGKKVNWTLSLNASPFYLGKHRERINMATQFCKKSGGGFFYCNMLGGQDELIFDGASFVMDSEGVVQQQLPAFSENESIMDDSPYPSMAAAAYSALTMGIRDYLAKTGFGGVVLGLSGGVDSALTAAAAADALGGKQVLAVMMPSRHTSAASIEDATETAENIGAELLTISIDPLMDAVYTSLSPHLHERQNDVTLENVQARLRGQLLMALANNRGLLLLATGNKSELACGYATLYGDMCGGFAPLKDVSKTRVWELCKYRNARNEIIPSRVITRAPSAELRDNQTDQETLPPYAQIDAAIEAHVEDGRPKGEWAPKVGNDIADKFLNLLAAGEHKRRQGAIGPKITRRAFGRDWRMPIAGRFRRDA